MRPSKYFADLQHAALSKLSKLRLHVSAADTLPFQDADRVLSFVTIEALNLWSEFTRAYFLSCLLRPTRLNGKRVSLSPSAPKDFDAALRLAASRLGGRTVKPPHKLTRLDEPAWHRPTTLARGCNLLGCSHQHEISRALSLPVRFFHDLPNFRNFFAHRNESTAAKALQIARRYSLPTTNHPTDILRAYAYGRPRIIIVDWLAEIADVVTLLCE